MDSCPRLDSRASVGVVVLPARPGRPPKLQTFHIEAGDATRTLNEFSRQSSLQLLFDYSVVRGRRTHAVSGDLPAPVALQKMLEDTGLTFDFVNDRTLSIAALNRDSGLALPWRLRRQRPHTRSGETQSVERNRSGSAAVPVDLETAEPQEVRRYRHPSPRRAACRRSRDLRGPRQHRTQRRGDSPGLPADPAPDVRRRTHRRHSLLQRRNQTNSGLGSGINLRGLGARATLVLINGKRLAPSGSEAAFADIENIPLSAVERIDILPDSASALYGADAVGGVVNFVMRDNFTGAESLARGGSGTRNTQEEYQLAQTLGSRWDSGNGMLSLSSTGAMPCRPRRRRYATSNLVPLGGSNFDTFLSNPGNIVFGNQTYAIPRGQNGTALTAGDLVPGTQNLSDVYADADLLPSQRRWSLYGSGKQSLTDNISLFGNAMVSQRDARQQLGGFEARITVPNSNPFYVNPTGGTDPVTVDYNFLDDIGPGLHRCPGE